MNTLIKETAIQLIDKALEQGLKVSVIQFSDLCKPYHDATGQRDNFIGQYNYGNGVPTGSRKVQGSYTVFRLLSFTNSTDVGKNYAVLATLSLNSAKKVEIKSLENGETIITMDEVELRINTSKLNLPFDTLEDLVVNDLNKTITKLSK